MFYFVCLILGITGLIVSIARLKSALAIVKNGARAIGTVIQLREMEADGGLLYAPVFEIKPNRQDNIIYQHHVASSPSGWAIGDKATFLLDPVKPDSIRLLSYSVFSYTIILMAVAIALIVTGAMYFCLQGQLT